MQITITAEHWDRANAENSSRTISEYRTCPVELAVADAIPDAYNIQMRPADGVLGDANMDWRLSFEVGGKTFRVRPPDCVDEVAMCFDNPALELSEFPIVWELDLDLT